MMEKPVFVFTKQHSEVYDNVGEVAGDEETMEVDQ